MKPFIYSAFLFFFLFNLSTLPLSAQPWVKNHWKEGQLDATLGIGLLPTFMADKARSIIPPLALGADYLISDKVSMGLQFTYTAAEKKREVLGREITWQNYFYSVSLRTGFHYTRISRWDIYGGMVLSQNVSRLHWVEGEKAAITEYLGIQESSSQFAYTAYLGGRYAMNEKMSLYAELGLLNSLLTVGFGYRLL